jgi:hypothetical protein
VRNPRLHRNYAEAKAKLRDYVRHMTWGRWILRRIGHRVDAAYKSMNLTQREKPAMSLETREFLVKYYEEEASRLNQVLGAEPPWLPRQPPGACVQAPVAA